MNLKLIGYPRYKVLTLIKGHLFNQDQHSTSKYLYSLIPWSQQHHTIWVVTHGGKEEEEEGVSELFCFISLLNRKAPKAVTPSAHQHPPPSTRPGCTTALLSFLSTHTSPVALGLHLLFTVPLIWRGEDEERKMSKAKEVNGRIRIQGLLIPKPSQLLSEAFKTRCSAT